MRKSIRKYGNRKLYDVSESRYVNLNEVYEFVRDGHEVAVFDSASKLDVTAVTLLRAMIEYEGQNFKALSTEVIKSIIKQPEFFNKLVNNAL